MFTNHFSSNVFHRFALTLIAIFALMGQPFAQAQSSNTAANNTVGKVAVSVGEAKRIASSGKTELLQVGLALSTGDKIVTGQDAVAILVFSDEGRIAVRPDSELTIKHYEVDPKGVNTRIELELTKGTIRQISGNASRSQPERYRLNTPIAVIGVRGTDFLAKTSQGAVEAFVHEGKIVMVGKAPGCDLGAQAGCASLATASAASEMSYVKFSQGGRIEQRAVGSGELEKLFGIELIQGAKNNSLPARSAESAEFRLPQGTKFVTDTIFAATNYRPEPNNTPSSVIESTPITSPPVVTPPVISTPVAIAPVVTPPVEIAPVVTSPVASTPVASTPVVSTPVASTPVVTPPVVSSPVISLPTTSIPQVVTPPTTNSVVAPVAPLVWGRFASASALPTQFMLAYEQASQGRHVTVGELGEYALWRTNPVGRLDPSLKGEASFMLNNAEAMLVQPTGTTAAQVKGASLSVNFDRSTFAAGVDLSHQATGAVSLNVSGKVNVEGVFVGTNTTERVAGALTLDGAKAGYLFSKDVNAGTFKGVTLWTRK
jgi:hypothetical protein